MNSGMLLSQMFMNQSSANIEDRKIDFRIQNLNIFLLLGAQINVDGYIEVTLNSITLAAVRCR